MSEDPKLYRSRAEAERRLAASSSLENQKGKALHAAARWDELADSAERVREASAVRNQVRDKTLER
jgi:hypothetical protein